MKYKGGEKTMRNLKLAIGILLLISILFAGPAQALVKSTFADENTLTYSGNDGGIYFWFIGEELFNHVFGEFDMVGEFTPTDPGDTSGDPIRNVGKAEQGRLFEYYDI